MPFHLLALNFGKVGRGISAATTGNFQAVYEDKLERGQFDDTTADALERLRLRLTSVATALGGYYSATDDVEERCFEDGVEGDDQDFWQHTVTRFEKQVKTRRGNIRHITIRFCVQAFFFWAPGPIDAATRTAEASRALTWRPDKDLYPLATPNPAILRQVPLPFLAGHYFIPRNNDLASHHSARRSTRRLRQDLVSVQSATSNHPDNTSRQTTTLTAAQSTRRPTFEEWRSILKQRLHDRTKTVRRASGRSLSRSGLERVSGHRRSIRTLTGLLTVDSLFGAQTDRAGILRGVRDTEYDDSYLTSSLEQGPSASNGERLSSAL